MARSKVMEFLSDQVKKQSRRLTDKLPSMLQKPAKAVRSYLTGDTINLTQKLMAHIRHRSEYNRFEESLIEFRYVMGVLMARNVGVFEALQERPLTPALLARRCDISSGAASILLRVLESKDLVGREGNMYALKPFGKAFLTKGGTVSLDPMLQFLSTYASSVDDISDGLETGEIAPNLDVFADESDYGSYLDAVNYFLDLAGREFLIKANLPDIRSFITGSMGVSFSKLILNEYPKSRVTYGCLNHLVDEIPALRMQYDIDDDRVDGMHRHSGDPMDDDWGADTYDMVLLTKKMILEPEDEIGRKFATKAYEILSQDGVAIFWETIHPDDDATPISTAMNAVLDLGASPNGEMLTRSSFREKLRHIGFQRVEYVDCLDGSANFAVAYKNQKSLKP